MHDLRVISQTRRDISPTNYQQRPLHPTAIVIPEQRAVQCEIPHAK